MTTFYFYKKIAVNIKTDHNNNNEDGVRTSFQTKQRCLVRSSCEAPLTHQQRIPISMCSHTVRSVLHIMYCLLLSFFILKLRPRS